MVGGGQKRAPNPSVLSVATGGEGGDSAPSDPGVDRAHVERGHAGHQLPVPQGAPLSLLHTQAETREESAAGEKLHGHFHHG